MPSTTVGSRTAPGIRQRLPLPYGTLKQARSDPLAFYLGLARRYGDVARWELGPFVFHLLADPGHVRHVLQDNYKNYVRSRFYAPLRAVMGEGMFVSEGSFWLRQRRLAQPAFQRQRAAVLAAIVVAATERMLERWEGYAASGETVDAGREMTRVALRVVFRALFTRDVGEESEAVGGAVMDMIELVNHRIHHLLPAPLAVPTARNLRFKRSRRILDDVIHEVIRERRGGDEVHEDLLGMLMGAVDEETGESMSDKQLRDEMATFILAGHETVAVTLSWAWYLLSRHPEIAQRLRDESRRALGDREPTAGDLPALGYARRVAEETLRIYPPVWAMTRTVVEDDVVGGFRIPARSVVIVSPYVTHRLPELWPDAEAFDPDRFLPESAAARPRFAYYPFSGGPRQCIGMEFALTEATLVLAMTARRFRPELVPGYDVEAPPILTLRPRGVPVRILRA